MSKVSEYIGRQLGNPHGLIGSICCRLMNKVNNDLYINTVSLLDIHDGDKLLDIGYGNGYLLECIYKECKADMYGIDISEDMRKEAERRNKRALREGNLHLGIGNCCNLFCYEDNSFKAVTSINTIYFWEDTLKGLSEIHRVLEMGASFYNVIYTKEYLDTVSYTQKGFKKYSKEQFVELGKQAGFEKAEVKEFAEGKSFAVIYTK